MRTGRISRWTVPDAEGWLAGQAGTADAATTTGRPDAENSDVPPVALPRAGVSARAKRTQGAAGTDVPQGKAGPAGPGYRVVGERATADTQPPAPTKVGTHAAHQPASRQHARMPAACPGGLTAINNVSLLPANRPGSSCP